MGESTPFESPLIPNARLREIYLAMMRLRGTEQSLGVRDRSGALGREACLVAASIGLIAGDLVSDNLQGPAIRFLRGQPLHVALQPDLRSRRRGAFAECGRATALPGVPIAAERLWVAAGASAALQAAKGRSEADQAATVVFLREGELAFAPLRKLLNFAGEQALPMIFFTMPAGGERGNMGRSTLEGLARRCGVPEIAVDAEDAVAIYRVVQESLGRARAGGGPALIRGVPFVLHGASRGTNSQQTVGALAAMETYILERQIVTPEWIKDESRAFARHLRQPVH